MPIDINTLALVLGIIATLIGGAVWVLTLIYRLSSQMTTERNRITSLEKKQEETDLVVTHEKEVNTTFRHKYKASLDQFGELFKMELNGIRESIDNTKEALSLKIDLALANQENKKNQNK